MAKRMTYARKSGFNIDVESLLLSDSSQECRQNNAEVSTDKVYPKPGKRIKSKDDQNLNENFKAQDFEEENNTENIDAIDDANYMTKFFENIGNGLNKSILTKKVRLEQFTKTIISTYHNKITDIIKRQEVQMEIFNKKSETALREELNKFEKEFQKLKYQEMKLKKILDQHFKILQKQSEIHSKWLEKFIETHHSLIQNYEEMKKKHKMEVLNFKNDILSEVSSLQSEFLMKTKTEEMHLMKKYLEGVCYP